MAKVTLQDVADVVGVSRMTVSNAFNRPHKLSSTLRTTILETAKQLGYTGPDPSARALARGRSGTVCFLLNDTLGDAFRDPVSTELLVAVGDALAQRSLALTLVAGTGENAPSARDLPMDGAIVYVGGPDDELEWLRQRGIPVVTVDRQPADDVPAVNVDDVGGSRAAAQHLLDLGHRRIGIVTVEDDAHGPARPAAQRRLGWSQPLAAAGVVPATAYAPLRRPEDAYDAVRALLTTPERPTALLCFSDVYAAHAIRAAADLGLRVPEDVSVVGYDDADFAATLRPTLTTVRQDVAAKGQAAVAALADLLDGRTPDAVTVLETQLIERASTGPAPV